jgi:hypothetical protein
VIDSNLFRWAPLIVVLPSLAFLVDWAMTVLGARAASRVSHRWSVEGSYEMNPTWTSAVDRGSWFNWRVGAVAFLMFALMAGLFLVIGELRLASGRLVDGQTLFSLAAGALLLVQAPTLMNHIANLQQFRALADESAASGQLRISRRLALSQTALLYGRFAGLWLVLWLASQQAFFLGGAIGCLIVGLRFWRLEREERAGSRQSARSRGTHES